MLLYLIIDVVVGGLFVLLAAVALFGQHGRDKQNQVFALFVGCLLLWLMTNQVSNDTAVPANVVIWADYILFGSSFAAVVVLFDLVVRVSQDRSMARVLSVLRPWLVLLVVLFATPLVGAGVHPQGGVYAVEFGPLGDAYGAALVIVMALALTVVIRSWHHPDQKIKRQMRIIGIGMLVTLPLVAAFGYIIPYITNSFAITQIAVAPCIILAVAFYHAAVRHGLFDLRVVVMRSIVYVLSLATLACVYFVLAYIISWTMFQSATVSQGVSVSPLNIVLALILAFLFQPIKKFFDQLTDTLFYRHEYNRDEFFSELGQILAFSSNIQFLLQRVANYIAKTMKAQQVFFAVQYNDQRRLFGTKGHATIPMADTEMLRDYIESTGGHNQLIRVEMLHDSTLRTVLQSRRIAIILPLALQDEHIGCLFMGEHQGRGYSTRDIRTLESISGELVIALRNARAIQEIKELNDSLKQRIEDATKELRTTNRQLQRLDEAKNEFISMASHQLRTPLTSIKGYLDMVLEGDLGKVTPTQKAVLREAFNSSERMVQLINDFLNVSRLQTGKFMIDRHPSDLAKLVREEIAMLDVVAKQRQLTIKAEIGKKMPEINIDGEKFRQVILNMIDNALYYSQPKSTVRVTLKCDGDDIVFTVKDTGIGVPAEEQTGLFGKFFRASNARKRRPDGTGVGLFLAKKVVLEHQGEVIFESAEGRGSTFGFRVPIKQPTR